MKKLVSMMLVMVLVIAMLPVMDGGEKQAQAATEGISNNGLYTIVNVYNGKALTQTDMSTFWANAVVWNTNAMSDLARWTLTERGEYYSMTNSYSGKSMKICGITTGSNCDFNGYDNSNDYKWKLVRINSGNYAGCYYIVSSRKTSGGEELYAEVKQADNDSSDGAQVALNTKNGENTRQIWRINTTNRTDTAFTESMANTMLSAFRTKYFKHNDNTGNNSLGWGFWSVAEVMEAMLDGYELTGNASYREMFEGTWRDFIARNSENWSGNAYNDDITWAALAACRAYMMFGDSKYLEIAKNNFDLMYNRASTYTINGVQTGVLRWCEESDKRGTSNGCINGPAIVCACHLAIATGDDGYWEKAKKIYEAQRNSNLYVAEGNDAGYVRDCIKSDGSVQNGWCSTYNQGTYLGGAVMLYNHYGDQKYATDADNIVNYTMNHLCYNRILKEENTNSGDLSGFRGILVRYMRMYILERDKNDYLDFFKKNAIIAWMNRNSADIQQCSWQRKTSENADWDEFAGYNAVCVAANMPTYKDSIDRNAYSVIEAEDMDYTRGLIAENSSGTSGGRSLGGVMNGFYTGYYNVDFGNVGASSVKFKYSRINESTPGTIEFKLDSKDGETIATASIDSTGGWSNWKEQTVNTTRRVTGKHKVYTVFKASTTYVCNFDYFQFNEYSLDGFSTIKAAAYDDHSGVVIDKDANGNPTNIGGVMNGNWIMFKSADFGNRNAVSIELNYASDSGYAQGKVEIYVDNMNGTPVGSIDLPNTGSNWSTYGTKKANLSTAITGKHDIYLKFVTTGNKAYVCNLKEFTFSTETYVEPTTQAPTTAEPTTEATTEEPTTIYQGPKPELTGYQISTTYEGTRVIGKIANTYNGKKAEKYGFVFGLSEVGGAATGISAADLKLGSSNTYVKSYEIQSLEDFANTAGNGTDKTIMCTMKFGKKNSVAYNANYMVCTYVVLSDGTVIYGEASNYSIYKIADYVYQNKLMNRPESHDYLYYNILKVVNPNYKAVSFPMENTLVK
ncbi:MAG: carbohydrate-binding protein [Eubacterium sp.]|nr:carbohydrate-binding protein [Eubacterium sp.]